MKIIKKAILLAVSFFLMGLANSWSLSLSDIRTQVRRNVRDADSSRQRYTDAFLLDLINEAQREIVNATWLIEKSSSYVLSPLTTYYLLPTDLLVINHVEFKTTQGSIQPLEEKTLKGLESNNPDWRKSNGQPLEYWVDQATTSAQQTISYIPIPTNTSTGTVFVRYFYQAPDLSADSDIPFDSKRAFYTYHMAMVYQVTYRIKLIERKVDESVAYLNMYTNYMNLMQSKLGQIPNYTPSAGAAGGRR